MRGISVARGWTGSGRGQGSGRGGFAVEQAYDNQICIWSIYCDPCGRADRGRGQVEESEVSAGAMTKVRSGWGRVSGDRAQEAWRCGPVS